MEGYNEGEWKRKTVGVGKEGVKEGGEVKGRRWMDG